MTSIKIPPEFKYIGSFLSMRCNLSCSYCINDINESHPLQRKDFKEISGDNWLNFFNALEFEKGKELAITLSGGEPSLHKDFIYVFQNLRRDLNVNILTNLMWNKEKLNNFIRKINPERIRGNPKYPAIRVSYHPEQMGSGEQVLNNVETLVKNGFSIGIESVMHPNNSQLSAIEQMAINCRNKDISFRVKSFAGEFGGKDDLGTDFSVIYGNYTRYPDSIFQPKTKKCLCRTSELLIAPNGKIHRCHRDLYAQECPIGDISSKSLEINYLFRPCKEYGNCNPCDVKDKTNSNQELGHTSVDIKDIKD